LQSSQLSHQNYGELSKSVVSIHGNGSENVSSVCTVEAKHGPQIHLRQANASQINHKQDLSRQNNFNPSKSTKPETSHVASINQDLVALSNSDLNLLGEFHFDNAQSFAYTESTIQTEHQRAGPTCAKPGQKQAENTLDGRFSMHQHPDKNARIRERFGLKHFSNQSDSSGESHYSDDKSRESCNRPPI
jgi:hypothetical protein